MFKKSKFQNPNDKSSQNSKIQMTNQAQIPKSKFFDIWTLIFEL